MKTDFLYAGKAKTIYATDDVNLLVIEYRNDATAFNGVKKAALDRKGKVNNYFNAHIMQLLETQGIATHLVKRLTDNESLVKKLEMIPIEFVIRNIVAGSMSKRFNLEEGTKLSEPVIEFFLKDDALGDPMVSEDHIRVFKWATDAEISQLRKICLQVNKILQLFFAKAEFLLVDFKLEFGRAKGELLLGDEFTLDGSRVWDAKTKEKFDKDRFRRDLGNVIEFYELAAQRLGIKISY